MANLLDLPIEVLEQIVVFVALLRYETSESRRPKPSALHHLAYGTNRLLRTLALPHLGRLATTESISTQIIAANGRLVDSRSLVRVLQHPKGASKQYWPVSQLAERYPRLEHLVLSLDPDDKKNMHLGNLPFFMSAGLDERGRVNTTVTPHPQVKTLEIRHGAGRVWPLFLEHMPQAFPSLETVKLFHCWRLERWLQVLTPTVTCLEVAVHASMLDMPLAGWGKVQHFPQPFLFESLRHFALALPPSSPLLSLDISSQLPTHFTTAPLRFSQVVAAIIASFGSAALSSLAIDEYARATPADLAVLSAAFPLLSSLSLGDRTIWEGSRTDFLDALSPLSSLERLECRLFPDSPACTLFPPPAAGEGEEADEFASPSSIALEAALSLPKLSLVGFSGRQSAVEWLRIIRDKDGQPERTEAVELYSMDLTRP
ncbi:hypothetical protein JCM10207_002351 [Rhodosporidiobolus poonsookiae]